MSIPATTDPPYAPSAVNRLFGAIERLPAGGWWVYPLLFVAGIVYLQAFLWITGRSPVGSIAISAIAGSPYGAYTLWAIHYLSRVADRAVTAFRPASGMTDEEFALRRYELTTIPAGRIWVALPVGAAITAGSILFAPAAAIAPYAGTPLEALAVLGPTAVFGYSMFPIIAYQTVRQLRLVARLHREATALDLFDTGPIYAFSLLTVRIGLGYVAVGYYSLTANASFQEGNPVALATLGGSVLLGVACFILPLWGIHGRLVTEKAGLVRAASVRVQAMSNELYRRVDAASLAGIKDVTDAMAHLIATREQVGRLPTWPWPPQVLRGFLSAVLLPVAVFLITRALGGQLR